MTHLSSLSDHRKKTGTRKNIGIQKRLSVAFVEHEEIGDKGDFGTYSSIKVLNLLLVVINRINSATPKSPKSFLEK